MRESTLTRRILEYLNSLEGCYARKTWGGPFSSAWPDIVACYRGQMLAIEDKTRRNKPSALQAAELRKWKKAGAIVLVARSLEEVSEVIK